MKQKAPVRQQKCDEKRRNHETRKRRRVFKSGSLRMPGDHQLTNKARKSRYPTLTLHVYLKLPRVLLMSRQQKKREKDAET